LGPVGLTAALRERIAALALVALCAGAVTACEASGPAQKEPEGGGTAEALSADEREEVEATLMAVRSGAPLAHEQDGDTFFNREGHLPERPAGHYREYTVETPGSGDRGARRLVIGADGRTWFTRDHYESFVEIDPEEFP
jgi:guanyl-specific ribonuclease Sa